MRVSPYFVLRHARPSLDSLHAHVKADTPLFVDPIALRGLDTVWGAECRAKHFRQFLSIHGESVVS